MMAFNYPELFLKQCQEAERGRTLGTSPPAEIHFTFLGLVQLIESKKRKVSVNVYRTLARSQISLSRGMFVCGTRDIKLDPKQTVKIEIDAAG